MLSYFVKTLSCFSLMGRQHLTQLNNDTYPPLLLLKNEGVRKGVKDTRKKRRMNYKLSLYGRSLFPPSLSLLSSLILSSLYLHWNIIPYCNYFLKVSTLKTCVYFTYTFNFYDFTFSLLSTKFNWCVNVVIEIQCLIRSRLPCTTTTYHPPLTSLIFGF